MPHHPRQPPFARCRRFLAGVVLAAAFAHAPPAALADRTTLAKPVYADVTLRAAAGSKKDEKLTGSLLSFDDTALTLKVADETRELQWADLTPGSAFALRTRTIDKTKAGDWLLLGKFGWSQGAEGPAKNALAAAVRMDASLKSQADAITASLPGTAVQTASAATNPSRELIGTRATTRPISMPLRPKDSSPKKPTEKYVKSTPQQDAEAIAFAHHEVEAVEKQLDVHFVAIETPHFLLFTDWDPREHDFLKTNLEQAYTAVSEQFEIPAKENVFVGKLPVYMFAKFKDYAKFTDSIGFLNEPTPRTLRGYYQAYNTGGGRLVMYKPAADDIAEAEKEWAHCLVHEFTHAFVARYRTNAQVPRWLNEGVAEVIAAKHFPMAGTYPFARRMASTERGAGNLFNDDVMPGGEWYPVMQTMVEYLISQNRGAFLKLFDAIKAGAEGEAALKDLYGLDYPHLFSTWRAAMLRSH